MADQDRYLKLLTQGLSGGAMRALGIEDVELREALPTELVASAVRVDTVWRMVDGRLFHLEFQTEREASLERFMDYDTRLARLYRVPVRTMVLYDARVASAPDTLDFGSLHYHVENVFLRHFQGESVLDVVAKHLAAQTWEAADRLRLALALGMATEDRRALFGQTLELLPLVPDADERELITAAILALSERVLTDDETATLVKELSVMSKILDEVKRQGREEGRKEGQEEGLEKGLAQGLENGRIAVARAMLAEGDAVPKIMRITGLTQAAIEALKTS